ncbi:SIMPL domain-containing protein [Brevundimonas sp.]|uniref:SIMPL domain-containing protein n=1 Tax=Brevundimonas sp. TaxID=1871086 RepID=UPI002D6A8A42|nr:SIMPL domain-containing protein [Brevundimonas sp.]HYC68132.1 SIMPL domain-containing protein [Brevundimonas sp.]
MRRLTFLLLTAALAGPAGLAPAAAAQTPPATVGERYVPAPWWMRDPVIASIGHVRAEVPANRATFSATFQTIERTAAEASRKAADQVRALSQSLAAYGVDAVRVETSLVTRPLYDQYRDSDGVLRENTRADRIERYQVDAVINVTVRDVAVIERVYAAVMAAQPTSIGQVGFRLEPDNDVLTWLADQAVRDAAARARGAAEAAGARLGPVRVIDPSGRACQTDVLAGWPSYGSGAPAPTTVELTGSRRAREPANSPTPLVEVGREDLMSAGQADAVDYLATVPALSNSTVPQDIQALALQPPMQWLSSRACVVYSLG